jgi:hypothetical protein
VDYDAKVTDLDTRRSAHTEAPRPTRNAAAFIIDYITTHAGPDGWVKVSYIREAGAAQGYKWDALHQARKLSTSPRIITSNTGPQSLWRVGADDDRKEEPA